MVALEDITEATALVKDATKIILRVDCLASFIGNN